MAGFVAGLGRARERKRKYALDQFQEQQRLQARQQEQFQGFKYAAALQGMRNQFTAGAMAQRRDWELQDAAQRQMFQAQQADEQRRWEQQQADVKFGQTPPPAAVTTVPEHLKGTPQGRSLAQLLEEQWRIQHSRDFDPNDPETKRALWRYGEAIQGILEVNPAPTREDKLKEALGESYEQYKQLPWQIDKKTGEVSLPTGFKPPEDAAQKQREQEQKRFEEETKDWQSLVHETAKDIIQRKGTEKENANPGAAAVNVPTMAEALDMAEAQLASRKPRSPAQQQTQRDVEKAFDESRAAMTGNPNPFAGGAPTVQTQPAQNPQQVALQDIINAARQGNPDAQAFLKEHGKQW